MMQKIVFNILHRISSLTCLIKTKSKKDAFWQLIVLLSRFDWTDHIPNSNWKFIIHKLALICTCWINIWMVLYVQKINLLRGKFKCYHDLTLLDVIFFSFYYDSKSAIHIHIFDLLQFSGQHQDGHIFLFYRSLFTDVQWTKNTQLKDGRKKKYFGNCYRFRLLDGTNVKNTMYKVLIYIFA